MAIEKGECDFCGGDLEDTVIEYDTDNHPKLGAVIFHNVPVKKCIDCSEIYYSAQVMKSIEKALEGEISPQATVTFPLFDIFEKENKAGQQLKNAS